MKTTEKYLEAAKKKLGIESDYELAKRLGIQRTAVSNYRTGRSVMDDYTAAKIAQALDINPLTVIATANAEREKVTERRTFWLKIASQGGGVPFCIFMIWLPFFVEGKATIVRIMRNSIISIAALSVAVAPKARDALTGAFPFQGRTWARQVQPRPSARRAV